MLVVPFSSDYDQTFITQLGEEKYVFDARWNERAQLWTVDMTRDSDQEQLLSGAPMLAGQDLLSPYALGIGGLVVTDLGLTNTDPGPDDLGERVIIAWLSNEELAEVRAALKAAGLPPTVVAGTVPPPPAGTVIVSSGSSGGGGGGGGTGGGGSTTISTTVNNTTNNVTLTGASTFGDKFEGLTDESGDEVLVMRDIGLPSVAPTLALIAGVLAAGNGTLRIYTGGVFEAIGSVGTPSGSLRDSAAVAGADTYEMSASFSNPGGMVPIKITMQSGAPATAISVDLIKGTIG